MARRLVYYCITVLTIVLIWAMVLKTVALFVADTVVDVSDVLTFAGVAFGGELLFLLVKRVCAKPKKQEENNECELETETDES
jgi:hypothetical protein